MVGNINNGIMVFLIILTTLIHKFFIRTYQKAPIVQHYTYRTMKTNNFIGYIIYHVHTQKKGERYITSTPNSGHHRFNEYIYR